MPHVPRPSTQLRSARPRPNEPPGAPTPSPPPCTTAPTRYTGQRMQPPSPLVQRPGNATAATSTANWSPASPIGSARFTVSGRLRPPSHSGCPAPAGPAPAPAAEGTGPGPFPPPPPNPSLRRGPGEAGSYAQRLACTQARAIAEPSRQRRRDPPGRDQVHPERLKQLRTRGGRPSPHHRRHADRR